MQPATSLDEVPDREADNVTVELMLFDKAVGSVRGDIRRISEQFAQSLPREELALFDAYLHMLDDEALTGDVQERIRRGEWAQGALKNVIREHMRRFEQMEDAYLKERATDVEDLGLRVLAYLQDIGARKRDFPESTILVGEQITPSMLTSVPAERLKGIVSVRGSVNSHVAILAHALGIPAVMGAVDMPIFQADGQPLIVDGFYGEVYANPSAELTAAYEELREEEREFDEELDELKELPCITLDGWRTLLWVNIGLTGDISRSLDRGAEGIGLFRTEVPFITQDRFPTEEEQRQLYREHMEAFEPRPVTMRTLDVGGDKALAVFPDLRRQPVSGLARHPRHPGPSRDLPRSGKSHAQGQCGPERAAAHHAADDLQHVRGGRGQETGQPGTTGKWSRRASASSRLNSASWWRCLRRSTRRGNSPGGWTSWRWAPMTSPSTCWRWTATTRAWRNFTRTFIPPYCGRLREVARHAHAEKKGLGICGELAGTPVGAVLLMAMGYQVLSMNATNLPKVKWVLRNVKRTDARRMLARVLKMETAAEIQQYMEGQLIEAGLGRVVPSHHDRVPAARAEG